MCITAMRVLITNIQASEQNIYVPVFGPRESVSGKSVIVEPSERVVNFVVLTTFDQDEHHRSWEAGLWPQQMCTMVHFVKAQQSLG